MIIAVVSGQILDQFAGLSDSSNSASATTLTLPSVPAPTIVQAAAASLTDVTGTTTTLSVLGADDNGEEKLTYTWAIVTGPSVPVTFSDTYNDNAAKDQTVTFTAAGTYVSDVIVTNAGGASVTSSPVTVIVEQSSVNAKGPDGKIMPVAHCSGHDIGAAALFAKSRKDSKGGRSLFDQTKFNNQKLYTKLYTFFWKTWQQWLPWSLTAQGCKSLRMSGVSAIVSTYGV